MHSEFEMSMMGELNFFLGLQIKQLKEGTFINQAKYIRDLLKRFNMEEAKTMKTPMSSSIKLDMDEKGFQFLGASSLCTAGLRVGSTSSPFRWMAPKRETSTSRAQGKRLAEPSQPEQTRLAKRRGMTQPSSVPSKTISATSKSSPRGKSSQGEVSISPSFITLGLRDSSVGWDGC
ncbi:hypothetical protein CK203_056889 [Vitis vinifera]|uniref:Reverse transcriptase Ty1/copia-type domain-containing protein n=1 Tax=Vitis vinifera TaxID=29760 RepID=A0A438GW51_VITVI|nr:hypothetical protein CK203_056889 [Vitis vinifera]